MRQLQRLRKQSEFWTGDVRCPLRSGEGQMVFAGADWPAADQAQKNRELPKDPEEFNIFPCSTSKPSNCHGYPGPTGLTSTALLLFSSLSLAQNVPICSHPGLFETVSNTSWPVKNSSTGPSTPQSLCHSGLNQSEVEGRIIDLLKNFDKVTDASKITPTSHFTNDLGLDSLDTVEVVMAIEEEFSIEIPDKEADAIHSIDQAVQYILSQPDVIIRPQQL
ncbi:hypothetical protein CIHG_06514 [Coccidioides immitis H538.4]|uniref:Acyl carrier protein n=1 Tax=Coccidioides immitis H538.4 TaxID=396776 RepID=A0A0J8RTP0_COCIT|nr:hypothetical protein CIHG_06514 [Coccidioides immitis H538.4]